jgi:hypothetical protein
MAARFMMLRIQRSTKRILAEQDEWRKHFEEAPAAAHNSHGSHDARFTRPFVAIPPWKAARLYSGAVFL